MIKQIPVSKWGVIFGLLILASITIWTYLPVHSFGYVDYDDPAYITGNPYVNSGLDARNILWAFTFKESKGAPAYEGIQNLYHPVTWISHMIDVELFGIDSPGAQHLMNLAIHLLAGMLLYFIFLKLLGHQLNALLTALLFCIHPLHVESVAWLSERKDTLSALFAFASILCYQFHVANQKNSAKWSSVVFFLLAMLSKPSVVILPGILMLLDQFQQHQMNKWDFAFLKKQLIHKAAWIIPSLMIALATLLLQQGGSHSYFMKDAGLIDRLAHIPIRLGYYLYHTFYPASLSFHYVAPPYPVVILAAICTLLLIAITFFSYRIRERFPLALFALLWFYICILPVSGIAYVGTSFIADRYTYLAIIGIFACISSAIIRFLPKQASGFLLALIIVSCAFLARQQTLVWKDSHALFSNAIQAQPRDAMGYVNLGARTKLDGDIDKASRLYLKAIEIAPSNYIAHHNLAVIAREQQQWQAVEIHSLKALEIYERYHPSMRVLSELYRTVPEMHDLEKALSFTKRYNQVVGERDVQMLGVEIELLYQLKRYEEARAQAEKLLPNPNLTREARQFIEALMHE